MKYIKRFKINEGKYVNIDEIKKAFISIVENEIFHEEVRNQYQKRKELPNAYATDHWVYLIEFESDDDNTYYILKIVDIFPPDEDNREYYIYDENESQFIKTTRYNNENLVTEIIEFDYNIDTLEDSHEPIMKYGIQDYIKTLEDRNKAFISLNEEAEHKPNGFGEYLDPKEAEAGRISIEGIYFMGQGYSKREYSDMFNKLCKHICDTLGIECFMNDYNSIEVDTDDIKIYFHPQQTVVNIRNEKLDLGEVTKWIANEMDRSELPIEVSYFFTK